MSKALALKKQNLALRKGRVRAKISGTAERPRLTVTISNLMLRKKLLFQQQLLVQKLKEQKLNLLLKLVQKSLKKLKKLKLIQ